MTSSMYRDLQKGQAVEADTIIGKNHQQAIVSLVERQSKLTRLAKVERNTEEAVKVAVVKLLSPLAASVADNWSTCSPRASRSSASSAGERDASPCNAPI